jgi:hypothetical protein
MEPTLDLQGAIVARLKADAALAELVSTSVFDRVPSTAMPYVVVGEDQDVPDLAECIDGSEIFVTINAYSRSVGKPGVKRIAGAVKASLHGAEYALELSDENRLLLIEHNGTIFRTEPDGLTQRAIMTFRALTEPL